MTSEGANLLSRQKIVQCEEGLAGTIIEISYPAFNPSITTLVRLVWLNGEMRTLVVGPSESAITLPDKETAAGVAGEYLGLGIDHILKGYDHLLFVACLLFIAGTWRRIFITITGFTVAHSITLVLSALNVVRLPVPPVEAVIALSIVFLASEIACGRRDTLTYRFPVVVSSSFGLLHGFGFAAVLGEIGLPQTELLTALLFFNLGVEVGQVIFAAAVIGVYIVLRSGWHRLAISDYSVFLSPRLFERVAAYSVGSAASYWMIDRTVDSIF